MHSILYEAHSLHCVCFSFTYIRLSNLQASLNRRAKACSFLISKNPSQPNGKNENKTFEQKFDFTL
jgi:hypothetical protein